MGFFSPELSELLSRLPVAVFSDMHNNAYHWGPVFSSHLAPKFWRTCLLTEKKDLQGNKNMDKNAGQNPGSSQELVYPKMHHGYMLAIPSPHPLNGSDSDDLPPNPGGENPLFGAVPVCKVVTTY